MKTKTTTSKNVRRRTSFFFAFASICLGIFSFAFLAQAKSVTMRTDSGFTSENVIYFYYPYAYNNYTYMLQFMNIIGFVTYSAAATNLPEGGADNLPSELAPGEKFYVKDLTLQNPAAIQWNMTGNFADSPYGYWREDAKPFDGAESDRVSPDDWSSYTKIYAPQVFAPPAISLTSSGPVTCKKATDPNNVQNENVWEFIVNSDAAAGRNIVVKLNYDTTFGYHYYWVIDNASYGGKRQDIYRDFREIDYQCDNALEIMEDNCSRWLEYYNNEYYKGLYDKYCVDDESKWDYYGSYYNFCNLRHHYKGQGPQYFGTFQTIVDYYSQGCQKRTASGVGGRWWCFEHQKECDNADRKMELPLRVIRYSFQASGPISGKCGEDRSFCKGTTVDVNTPELCLIGTPVNIRGDGPWKWDCESPNGGETDFDCQADVLENTGGLCGSADNATYCPGDPFPGSYTPCANGDANPLNPPFDGAFGGWKWKCIPKAGSCPDSMEDDCDAELSQPTPGECGTANSKAVCDGRALTLSELCKEGEPSPTQPKTDGYEVVWTCSDTCTADMEPAHCSAKGKKSCGWIETNP